MVGRAHPTWQILAEPDVGVAPDAQPRPRYLGALLCGAGDENGIDCSEPPGTMKGPEGSEVGNALVDTNCYPGSRLTTLTSLASLPAS